MLVLLVWTSQCLKKKRERERELTRALLVNLNCETLLISKLRATIQQEAIDIA